MKQLKIYEDSIKKPLKPHRIIDKSEIPTKEEVAKRMERIKKLKRLGIEVNVLDHEKENTECEEDLDKLRASILIMQDKELPEKLEQKLMVKVNNKLDCCRKRYKA